jgi:hypothetical protein
MTLSSALTGLRDVDDVHGSFVVAATGQPDVGPRLVRLRETLDSSGPAMTQLVLRFAEHKLYVRAVGRVLLCVLTGARVNGPALRMATNLVAKRVETGSITLPDDDEPTTVGQLTPSPPRASVPAPAPAPPPRREILYRGRRPG